MRTRYDEFCKRLLIRLLQGGAQVQAQVGVEAEAQHIDFSCVPTAGGEAYLAGLGWLGKMTGQTCIFECYHDVPDLEEWRDCLHKQSTWHQARRTEARRLKQDLPAYPQLWVVAAGRPTQLIRRYALESMAGWPVGFYSWIGADVGLVVVRELPVHPDTLFLRLLGAGRTCLQAILEGRAHPLLADIGFRQLLVALRLDPDDTMEEDRELMESLDEIYAKWELATIQRGEEQGIEKGIEKGVTVIHQTMLNIYAARFGEVPPAVREAVLRVSDLAALSDLNIRFAIATREQISVALGLG